MKYIFARLMQSKYIRVRELRKFFWNTQSVKAKRKNRYLAEQMEARYLLSADLAPFAGDQALRDQIDHQQVIQQVIENGHFESEQENDKPRLQREVLPDFFAASNDADEDGSQQGGYVAPDDEGIYYVQQLNGHQVVLVDTAVDDYQLLLDRFMGPAAQALEFESIQDGDAQLAEWQEGETRVSVVLLEKDSKRDSIELISDLLSNYQDVSALHVLSHAQAGELQLGNALLNNDNLETYDAALRGWGESLTDNGDILFYGCNLSAGEVGFEFIERLAGVTAADIAASDNLTGNSRIGGDWVLETEFGVVEVPSAFSSNDPQYAGVLAKQTVSQKLAEAELSDFSAANKRIELWAGIETLDFTAINQDIRLVLSKVNNQSQLTMQKLDANTGLPVAGNIVTYAFAAGDTASAITKLKVGNGNHKVELELNANLKVLDTSRVVGANVAISTKSTVNSDAWDWVKLYEPMGIEEPDPSDATAVANAKAALQGKNKIAVILGSGGGVDELRVGNDDTTLARDAKTRLILDPNMSTFNLARGEAGYMGNLDLVYQKDGVSVRDTYVDLSGTTFIRGITLTNGFTAANIESVATQGGAQLLDLGDNTDVNLSKVISAGSGSDLLISGAGKQTLIGGEGNDTYKSRFRIMSAIS
ncbi:DUF4347 domain-containing protein [Aestuariicella sp. G3-2]|uniref:DUF4347 domain-containing protein n=1 Tax=Pseudomaricurvus albidus TaxID=2842452 RepID=UPI001C0BAF40|nr:DUF4347 domain-containing protein [Aestuariicella albida]MBU3071749.1 DUF4347 domain-containing protein [Aestuariicella albida]